MNKKQLKTVSYLGRHTSTRFITEVKQRWAWLVLGWVTAQMTSSPGAVKTCNPHLLAWECVREDTVRSYSACLREISQNTLEKKCTKHFV
jgi:hypothetical protein